ncbi:MAG: Lrp/AsnC family transcriptional regulator [Salinarchaeum sp.]
MNKRELLAVLSEDARRSTADIARMLDADEAEVTAAIEELEDAGIIQGYQAIVDWRAAEDQRVRAEVELNVALDQETNYEDIAERLAQFPEVVSLQLVSGDFDFLMRAEGTSMQEVSQFISDKVAPVPEVTQTVTHYVMNTYKERGESFETDTDDDRLSVSP